MRFCYLRIALLTSAFAANGSADTAEMDANLAASRTVFARDNFAASAVTETHKPTSVDDEDRASKTMVKFAEMMGKTLDSSVIKGLHLSKFISFMRKNITPKELYHKLGIGDPIGNVLSNDQWIRWAFFVYKLGRNFQENDYEFIVTAMSAIHDAETLSSIIITAANAEDTKSLAIELAKVADDHIRRLVFDRLPELASKLSPQKKQSAKKIYQTRRDRIFTYLKKHVEDNKLQDENFFLLTSYLGVLRDENNAAGTTLSISHNIFEDAGLLDKLLSLKNFRHQDGLESLVSVWLDGNIPPTKVVSMLVQDKAKADHFTILFSNGPKKRFWLRYLEKYNEIEQDTLTANVNFEQLLQILLAVVEKESPAADKYMAFTTILKMLVSPSCTHFDSRHELEIKLMSILLMDRILPSNVLSMLMHGAADTDKFNILFVNQLSKRFWLRYLKEYNHYSVDDEDFTDFANSDFQHLLMMLHAVIAPESSTARKFLANSTLLRVLISPEIANVVTAQKFLKGLTSNWLKHKLPPSTVVLLLVRGEQETDYFKILFMNEPSSQYWEDYTNAFYADKNHKMSTLIDAFGDAEFKTILKAGLTDEATSKKAETLLDQLK